MLSFCRKIPSRKARFDCSIEGMDVIEFLDTELTEFKLDRLRNLILTFFDFSALSNEFSKYIEMFLLLAP